jgi:RHS repeat-associated protein
VLQAFAYTYDANGNRLTQADATGTTTFTYDALNRLTQAAHPGSFGTWSWTYDAVGNRTQQTAPPGAVLPGVGSIPPLIAYTYDANNRLTQAGSTTYAYDANGNLTSISTGQTFTWDVFNRLTQTTGPGGTVTYLYNGDGLKLRRVGPDGTTNYYHDGIRPIWETNASGQLTNQYDRDIFGNLLSRRDNASVRWYYHHDGLGSTSALTNSTGSVVATMLHDAWGNIRTNSGTAHGNYRFTGAERDATTGLYHMGARFYDPVVGRWLSEDPVQDKHFEPATLNFYAYVNANPLFYIDPDGKAPQDIIDDPFNGGNPGGGPGGNAMQLVAQWAGSVILAAKAIGARAARTALQPVTNAAIRISLNRGLVGPYDQLSKRLAGTGLDAHHIIPGRFAPLFGMTRGQMPAIALPHHLHISGITAQINALFHPGQDYTKQQVMDMIKNFLSQHYPDLLEYLSKLPEWSRLFGGN